MSRLRYNGLVAALGGSGLTSSATSITFAAALTYDGGTSVPTISSDTLPLTILDSDGVPSEIVYLTAYTSGGTTGTITRGQESTSGVSHSAGAVIVNAPTTHDWDLLAPLASPALTGTPTAPTADPDDNSTTVATTAYVDAAAKAAASTLSVNAQTGTTYTLVLADAGKLVTLDNASAVTLTIPPHSSVAFATGTVVNGAQLGAGQVTISPGSGVTVNGAPGLNVGDQYGAFALVYLGSDVWLAMGYLSS